VPLDRLNRHPERGSTDRVRLNALLDGQFWGTLSTVSPEGEPWVVPVLFARDGDRVLVHGSTGAGALRAVASGAPVAFCVVAMDALVVGSTTFDSSANYRSAVLRGTMTPLEGAEHAAALDVLSDDMIPGRVAEVRTHTARELAATIVLALPIAPGSWLYKERQGQASEPGEPTDAWGGVVPIVTSWGDPVAAPWTDTEVPASVRRLAGDAQA
jgi:hypothetical protein